MSSAGRIHAQKALGEVLHTASVVDLAAGPVSGLAPPLDPAKGSDGNSQAPSSVLHPLTPPWTGRATHGVWFSSGIHRAAPFWILVERSRHGLPVAVSLLVQCGKVVQALLPLLQPLNILAGRA